MRVLLAAAVISGCQAGGDLQEPELGSVHACLGGPDVVTGADGSFDINVEGTVIERWAWDFNLSDCSGAIDRAVQIEDDNGDIWSLGIGLLDEDNDWVDSRLAPKGRNVNFTYRYRHPWGDVAGFVLSDVDGIIMAADEGSWGGALRNEDVPGLKIYPGEEIVAEKETDCAPTVGFDMHFDADSDVIVPPVGSETIFIDGHRFEAHALDAHEDAVTEGCSMPDTPGIFAWAITR